METVIIILLAIIAYYAYRIYLQKEDEKEVIAELNCRQAGLSLHDRLTTTEWKDLGDEKGQKSKFHKPHTRYDKKEGKCLLLTGYSFILEDKHGQEEREVVKVIDVTNGNVIEELRFGYGHEPGFGKGTRAKDQIAVEAENEEMARYKQLLREFGAY